MIRVYWKDGSVCVYACTSVFINETLKEAWVSWGDHTIKKGPILKWKLIPVPHSRYE